jgi:hypothetical protein
VKNTGRGIALRLRTLTAVWFAALAAIALSAQTPSPAVSASATASPAVHGHGKPNRPPAPAAPQAIFDATSLGSPVRLDKDWRIGITAAPTAASPTFDDSAWEVHDAQAYLGEISEEDRSGKLPIPGHNGPPAGKAHALQPNAWFRLHIQLPAGHGPLALLLELPVSTNASFNFSATGPTPMIFANGRQIQPEGPNGNTPLHYQQISRIYNLNLAPDETSLTLAVRAPYFAFGYGATSTFFASRTFYLGKPDDLQRRLDHWSFRNLFERLPRLVYSAMLIVLAIFLFALYFAQKGRVEYLWLALHELVQAPVAFVELAGSSARIDSLWYAALIIELELAAAYLFFEFLVAFLALGHHWYIKWLRYTAPVLATLGPALLFVGHNKAVEILLFCIVPFVVLWVIGWMLFIFITLAAATLRRNYEAGLLLIPIVLSLVGIIEPIVISVISEETGVAYNSPLTILAGPIPIHFASIANFAGILVIVLIIFFRFLRIHHERERATSELEAARSMQELLIPHERPATPCFEIDSVYNPASEVGGDFFHVQTFGKEGVLVVIGDVAGKGLKAAMNVSLLMGALRSTPERRPSAILSLLNRVLPGTDSFTTCQALWFGADGEVAIANAGHLPPYLNSQEVNLPGGLPLGVVKEIGYEETQVYLHYGDRLLLYSDGVVEARRSSGELFGFERIRNFSQQSAFFIAEAAKSFGQQDDITVLTVLRTISS